MPCMGTCKEKPSVINTAVPVGLNLILKHDLGQKKCIYDKNFSWCVWKIGLCSGNGRVFFAPTRFSFASRVGVPTA